ncbi:fatty acid desaturase [Deinobacterium chartae]|uniref:Fatty acid desaturase n=1 Tax=Deinobacterium chartae TaxID=521158 RepID=A0A841HXS4_9DEIO|nr:fatty acid desaturase [Deinobacterium chartae]
MTELNHLRVYTKELKQHLPRDIFQPVPARLLWLIPYLGLIIAGALIIALTSWPIVIKIVLSLMMGFSFASLGFLGHEVLHGSVVKTPWLRDTIGGLCFFIFGLSSKLWRKWHNVDHHGHTQHPSLDPDAFETLEEYHKHVGIRFLYGLPPALRSFANFVSFTFWFSLLSPLMLKHYHRHLKPRERAVMYAQTLFPYLFWITVGILVGPVHFILIVVIPALIANFLVMSYIATNHLLCPLTETNDPLANSLTIQNPRWLDFLHLNFSHHVEHHIFPSVNPVHAPKIRALLLRLYPDRYQQMTWGRALLTLWRTPRLYGPDHKTLVSPEGMTFGTLGHGLDPKNVRPKK